MIEGWKKLAIRAAGFGAGFALISALLIGATLWWSSRPVKPKPWNTKAITAEFSDIFAEGEKNTLVFVFTLQNNTEKDIQIADDTSIHLGALLQRSNAFSFDIGDVLKTDYPIYIPAKSRVRFKIHVNSPYSINEDMGASDDVRHDWETTVCKYVNA